MNSLEITNMQHLRYIDLYEDGAIQRRVSTDSDGSRKMTKIDKAALRRKLYKELENAAKRNPEKKYWLELRQE